MAAQPAPAPDSSPRTVAGRIWAFMRIINVRLRFILLMVAVGLVSAHWEDIMNRYDRWRRPAVAPAAERVSETEYFCPMHPNVVRAEPEKCPICGMPLSQRARGEGRSLPAGVLAQVQLTPVKMHMGRIATAPVEYRLLARETRAVGAIDYDETRVARASARIAGRIEQLFVNYVGQRVAQGDPLFSIYSPDLLVAQEELLAAESRISQGGSALLTDQYRTQAQANRRKLLLWGVSQDQIDALLARGTAEAAVTFHSTVSGVVTEKSAQIGRYVTAGENVYTIADLTTVWLQARIFESEIAGVEIGTAVEITSVAYPDEIFAGRVAFIAYSVDSATRTLAARVEVANPDLRLKPGMYVQATIRTPVGAVTLLGGEAASQPATPSLLDTAPLARAYLKLAAAFADDRADEGALAALREQARTVGQSAAAGAAREAATAIAEQAGRMREKTLAVQREEFKSLSNAMIRLLRLQLPSDLPLHTVHCPMARADWLSAAAEVVNPYYGSEMLACGEVTGRLAANRSDERSESGYFCPIYPDRLYAQPSDCPVEKFAMPFVRIEKSPAVPASAVIRTGERTVVYREGTAGVFDLVEVRLGPQSGEYYPLLAGLQPGELVATRGAFLIDAENRLNPAAAAQFFGASTGTESNSGAAENKP